MNSENFKNFVETIDVPNTKKVVKTFDELGKHDYTDCTFTDLEKIILSIEPKSKREIDTICYVFKLFAEYLGNKKLVGMIEVLNKNSLWKKAKPNAERKFISDTEFKRIYKDIDDNEDFNELFYKTLFRSIYEGVYCNDMSVLKNLRASDIHGNIATLHNDDTGETYNLEISEQLAKDLKELASIYEWQRKNRWGAFGITIEGVHYDSCFKFENRGGNVDETMRFSFYVNLKKVLKNYTDYQLHPLHLFISGIMYRIKSQLKEHNINLNQAFNGENNNIVNDIIAKELERCRYNTSVTNFKLLVKYNIEQFEK